MEGHPRNPGALNNCDFLLRHVGWKEGRGAIIIYTCAAGVEDNNTAEKLHVDMKTINDWQNSGRIRKN